MVPNVYKIIHSMKNKKGHLALAYLIKPWPSVENLLTFLLSPSS